MRNVSSSNRPRWQGARRGGQLPTALRHHNHRLDRPRQMESAEAPGTHTENSRQFHRQTPFRLLGLGHATDESRARKRAVVMADKIHGVAFAVESDLAVAGFPGTGLRLAHDRETGLAARAQLQHHVAGGSAVSAFEAAAAATRNPRKNK